MWAALPSLAAPMAPAALMGAVAFGRRGERFADLRPEPPAEASPRADVAPVSSSPIVQPEPAARPPWAGADVPEIADVVSRARGSVVNIVALNGCSVESAGHLRDAVAALGAGRQARLEVRRGLRTLAARVVLGQLPSRQEAP